jgi:hypothetical protein
MDNDTCSLEKINEEKKLINKVETEVEKYVKLIFDILNKNIESTIEQRNDIYKFIKNTDFSDNSYFLDIKNSILEIINKDTSLLEEYNKINSNQSGGVKKLISLAFVAFAALSNALTYHADQSDYATSAAKLNPETSLVTIGNQIRDGSCGFGSSAVIHGNKFKTVNSIKDSLITGNTFGLGFKDYNKILSENELPGVKVVTIVPKDTKQAAKEKLTGVLSEYGNRIKQKGLNNGEFRTMIHSWTYKINPQEKPTPTPKPKPTPKEKKTWSKKPKEEKPKEEKPKPKERTWSSDGTNAHARVVIWDTQGNLAAYDPNIGFIYSREYGLANPEVIKEYKLIRNKPGSVFHGFRSNFFDLNILADNSRFQVIETLSIPNWIVDNQAWFETFSNPDDDKFRFNIDFNPDSINTDLSADVVSVDSLNTMESNMANIYQKQIDIAPFFSWDSLWGTSSKVKKWISTHQTPKIGGQAPVADTPIDFVLKCVERIEKNPYQFKSPEYEIYNSKVIYSELYPETLEEIEKTLVSEPLVSEPLVSEPLVSEPLKSVNKPFDSSNPFSLLAENDDEIEKNPVSEQDKQYKKQQKKNKGFNTRKDKRDRGKAYDEYVTKKYYEDTMFPMGGKKLLTKKKKTKNKTKNKTISKRRNKTKKI